MNYIDIVDWSRFQHYQNGRGGAAWTPSWIKLYVDIIDEFDRTGELKKFRRLPDPAKLTFLMLLCLRAKFDKDNGRIPYPSDEWLASRLGLSTVNVKPLVEAGYITLAIGAAIAPAIKPDSRVDSTPDSIGDSGSNGTNVTNKKPVFDTKKPVFTPKNTAIAPAIKPDSRVDSTPDSGTARTPLSQPLSQPLSPDIERDIDIEKEKEKEKAVGAKKLFADAYALYLGVKRSVTTEFFEFKSIQDWAKCLPLLKPAIEKQNKARELLKSQDKFVPEVKHFKNWLRDRDWEIAIPELDKLEAEQQQKAKADQDRQNKKAQEYLKTYGGWVKEADPEDVLARASNDVTLLWVVKQVRPEILKKTAS